MKAFGRRSGTTARELLHEPALLQPLLEAHDPVADGPLVARAQAEAVATGAVDVQLGDDAGALEAQIGFGQPLGNVLPVGVGGGQEGGRRFFRRLDVTGAAGIDERLKVQRGRLAIDRIGGRRAAAVGFRRGHRHELAAGGEADRADPADVDVPFPGAAPDEPNRALGIGEGLDVDLVGRLGFAGQAVLQHERGDPVVAQPLGDVVAFVRDGEHAVPAARDDEDRGAVGLVARRQVRREARVVDARDAQLAAGRRRDGFLGRLAFRTRRARRPE